MTKTMTRNEVLTYLEKFNGRVFRVGKVDTEEVVTAQARDIVEGMVRLVERVGAEHYASYHAIMFMLNGQVGVDRLLGKNYKSTTNYYRIYLDDNKYSWVEIQVGWVPEYSKAYGKDKKRYLRRLKGVFTHNTGGKEINPSTGHPYTRGDVKNCESGHRSAVLTDRGWVWGD